MKHVMMYVCTDMYGQTCFTWTSNGTVKYGHIIKVAAKCKFNWVKNTIWREINIISHDASWIT